MPRGPKSRHGCQRCKNLKLKCDEAKPACGRCVRLGSSCPGPVHKLRWSNKHEVFRVEDEEGHSRNTSPPYDAHENNITSSTPKSPLPLSDPEFSCPGVSVLNNTPPLDHNTMFDDQYTTHPHGTIELADTGLNGHLLGHLFSGFLDTVDDPLAPLFWSDDVPQQELFQHVNNQITTSGSRQTLPENICQAAQRNSKNVKRTKRSRSIFTPFLYTPKYTATILVEFYFSGTAQAYSVYDSGMNPFRSTVSRLWDSSRVIYLSLQSMAAACLVEIYPALGSIGAELRQEALELLTTQENKGSFDDKALLALLMLGGTSSWNNARDTGVSLFNSFRRHVERMRISGQLLENSNSLRFFQESLMYWEMLLAYVVDDEKLERSSFDFAALDLTASPGSTDFQSNAPRVPHPWTGFARDTQIIVLEIGRLVRSQRLRAHRRSFTTQAALSQLQSEMMRASELEAALLRIEPVMESDVVSPEDRQTPVWHLLNLAEVYCQVGLLQLYRVFPDLLKARLQVELQPPSPHCTDNDVDDRGSLVADDNTPTSQPSCNDWLTNFALQTLSLLAPIPVESGTRDFQPFLLVACCSELRYPQGKVPTRNPEATSSSGCQISMRVVEVSRARALILSRLKAFLHCLPPKPIHRCIDIVEATWKVMDEQNQDTSQSCEDDTVYWMDVIIEKGWETTMG